MIKTRRIINYILSQMAEETRPAIQLRTKHYDIKLVEQRLVVSEWTDISSGDKLGL
jgi:hypothetical protein